MSSSLKLVITFQKCLFDANHFKTFAESFFAKLNEDFQEKTYSKPKNIDNDYVYTAELYEIEVILKYSTEITYRKLCAKVIQEWCNPKINELSNLWLRIADPSVIENNRKLHHSDVQIKEIAFGTFPDMQHFMQHYHYHSLSDEKELMATFLHSQRKLSVFTCFTDKHCKNNPVHNKFEINYQSISRVIINSVSDSDLVEVYFYLDHTPFIYNMKEEKGSKEVNNYVLTYQEYQTKLWNRVLDFGCKCQKSQCSIKRIGRCPVFKIIIPKKHKTYDIIERLMQRCSTNTLFHFATIKTLQLKLYQKTLESLKDFESFPFNNEVFRPVHDRSFIEDVKFKCQFAWEVVHCKSYEIKDQILLKYEQDSSTEHWGALKNKLKSYFTYPLGNNHSNTCRNLNAISDALTKSFYDISEMINRKIVFVFEDALDSLFEHNLVNMSETDEDDGMCLIRCVILLPSKIICLPPSEHFGNRVIRQYGAENFLRISIKDDNFQTLTFAIKYHDGKEFFMRVAGNFLLDGIEIGPRKYEVLASSNSQLRDHGIWMYAKDQSGNTAESIREWMGDFHHIKNVAKYMSRMGLCFSTSESVQIELNEDEVINLPDITTRTEDKEYVFSDGVGMISKDLAAKVRYALRKKLGQLDDTDLYEPSAFQIRFQGCKGMLVESTTLSGCKIGIRPSMRKFPCYNSNVLEIVKISAPRAVFLNRPLITILENLGVKESVFLDLQKKMVFDLTDSLIDENKSCKILVNYTSLEYPFKQLKEAGMSLTQDPFFRSLLLCVYKSLIGNLKRKARIAIPPECGRNMFGVMDETGTLEYGQIFAQFSKEVGIISSPTESVKGTVVVTTNPCMHPGDVRKFKAVDVPALRHIKDCIVFPSVGKRPHPDEMAGSDLDGDEYVLIWEPKLKFPKKNRKPMNFPKNEETTLNRDIEVADMVDFLCTYIQNDNIGTMANAHLVWADYHEDGIFSKVCMSIAHKYPQVLDFAKSGTTKYLERQERPIHYPDFMEKGSMNNNYKSIKILGRLYRVVRNLEASICNINSNAQVSVDSRFEYPGWEMFENLANYRKNQYVKRVKNILMKYGVKNESEVLTGYINELNEYNQSRHDCDNVFLLIKRCMFNMIKRYQIKFLKDCEGQEKKHKIPEKELKYRMASAWYMVTYQDQETSILGFPWIISNILLEILNKNNKERRTSSKNTFFHSDELLLSKFANLNIKECQCLLVLHDTMHKWIKNSAFILTKSSDDVFCNNCLIRVIENFRKYKMSCCSFIKKVCNCSFSCSPTKLVLECFKYYASEIIPKIGICPNDKCEGFQDLNLQSLALKTYAVIAVTQSMQYLNPFESTDVSINGHDEEGDPIRIQVSEEFKKILTDRVDDVINILKSLTGVKQVHIEGNKYKNDCCYILVQSIGKSFNRWNLEELLMDPECPSIIENRLS